MFHEEFARGGPVMLVIFLVWVLLIALVLDRVLFFGGRMLLSPARRDALSDRFVEHATRNLAHIEGLSHLATGLGLFGTVWGIARAFFARGDELKLSAPEVMASGMATALYTTVAGLAVFLVGQAFLVTFHWWMDSVQLTMQERAEKGTR